MNKDRIKELETISALAAVCVLLFAFHPWKPLLALSFALAAGGALSEKFARAVSKAWLGFGKALGAVVNRIVLALVFYLVLTPLALLRRLLGADPLCLKRKREGSYFTREDKTFTAQDLKDPW